VECENKSDKSNNRGDWNHSKIRQYLSNTPGKNEIKKKKKKKIK
jgi:hypothetical protein